MLDMGIVEKWESCRSSLSFGLFAGDEAGYALKEEGYNEHYACERPEIVAVYPRIFDLQEREGITRVAVFHDMGKPTEPSVRVALLEMCFKCPFYTTKS